MDKLLKEIEGLIIEKSLSLEVIQIVGKIKEEHAQLTKENEKLVEEGKEKDNNYLNLKKYTDEIFSKLNQSEKELSTYKDREKEFNNSEHKTALVLKDKESSDRALSEVKEVVGLVFKNTIIRKGINKSTTVPVVVNGYPQNHTTSESYNEEEIEL